MNQRINGVSVREVKHYHVIIERGSPNDYRIMAGWVLAYRPYTYVNYNLEQNTLLILNETEFKSFTTFLQEFNYVHSPELQDQETTEGSPESQ